MPASTNKLGRYEIIREIARSNDIVYEAIDPSIGRRIALKELQMPPNLVGSAKRERIERFYREAKAAGHLTHPNIVTIYEVGEEAGRHFIAMEFLEGQTLQDAIEIRGAIPPKEAVDIVLQILDGLQYAHEHGVIHRDIKPANIQLLPGGRVKLTDFGIARITAEPSITANGQIFGTPSYMSPEQIAGRDIDARSDLFSVGIVLYESLTASKPFTGDSVVTITYNIMNSPAPRPDGVSNGLANCVEKALSKGPSQRFQSAGEFVDVLKSNWNLAQTDYGAAQPPQIFFPQGQPPPAQRPFPNPGGYGPTAGGTGPQAQPSPHLQPPSQVYQPRVRVRKPPKPLLSSSQKATLTTTLLALVLGLVILFAIWSVSKAYDAYQQQLNDKQAAPYVERGDRFRKRGDYREAVSEYESAIKMDVSPKNKELIKHNLGVVYVRWGQDLLSQGNASYAIQILQRALQSDPDSGDTLYLLGNAYSRIGRSEEALTYWEQAAARDSTSPGGKYSIDRLQNYYFSLAQTSEVAGDTPKAIDNYRRVIDVDAGTPLAMKAQAQMESLMLR